MPSVEQKLSQLLDDDLSPQEKEQVIETLLQDHSAQEVWGRYQLIRNALRNNMSPGENLVDRVRAVIDKEDIYAPSKIEQQ